MKKTIIFSVLSIIVTSVYSQNNCPPDPNPPISDYCEEGQGIKTDPNNPVNDACPNLKNNFDWRVKHTAGGTVPDEYYYIYGPNAADNPVLVRNPFNGPIDASYTPFLTANHGSNYQPEEGWELLKVEFGALSNVGLSYTQAPGEDTVSNVRPKLPYMMLYNRYTGTLRFFGSLMEPDNTYETVRIELRVPSEAPQDPNNPNVLYQNHLSATNLLSIQGESVQPLDKETEETALSVFVKYTNNSNVFFWFDVPVAYDPCLCNNRVQFDVSFRFVQRADIDITGSLTGTIKTESKGSQDYAKMVFGRVLAAGVSGAVAIKTGGAVVNYKSFIDLLDIVKDHPSRTSTEKSNLTELKNYLTCTKDYAKIIGKNYKDISNSDKKKKYAAAQKIVDGNTTFLSSLVKGCGSGDKGATVITGDIRAKGTFTLTDVIAGTQISMAMPGSDWTDMKMQSSAYSDSTGKIVPAYPTYNERLGTFALLETPAIKVSYRELAKKDFLLNANDGIYYQYVTEYDRILRLESQGELKYAFNPTMNVDLEKTKILFRYVTKQKLNIKNSGFSLHGVPFTPVNIIKNEGSMYHVSTPFIPIEYYKTMGPIILPIMESTFSKWKYPNGNLIFPGEEMSPRINISDSLFIQFKILMTSTDAGREGNNQAYYFFTYPIKVDKMVDVKDNLLPPRNFTSEREFNMWVFENNRRKMIAAHTFTLSTPVFSGDMGLYNQDIIFQNDDVFYYNGLVEISAKLSTTPGKKVKIYSTVGFELLPGAEIGPNIELVIGYPFESKPIPAQTYAEVSSFCSNATKYKAQEFASEAKKEEQEEYKNRQSKALETKRSSLSCHIYPNPSDGNILLKANTTLAHVRITNLQGSLMASHALQKREEKISISHLSKGVYFIHVQDHLGNSSIQKIMKK